MVVYITNMYRNSNKKKNVYMTTCTRIETKTCGRGEIEVQLKAVLIEEKMLHI